MKDGHSWGQVGASRTGQVLLTRWLHGKICNHCGSDFPPQAGSVRGDAVSTNDQDTELEGMKIDSRMAAQEE
jgi:hypothetical protein